METFKAVLLCIFNFAMYANIAALIPQPLKILTKGSADGVSIITFGIFFVFQVAVGLHGKLNLKSNAMFYGMFGSAVVSLTTVILCLIY